MEIDSAFAMISELALYIKCLFCHRAHRGLIILFPFLYSSDPASESSLSPSSNASKVENKKDHGLLSTPTRRSFRPLNREDFFQRLNTFTAFTWFAKPSELSPLQCARYGWENIEADTLKCMSCKEILFAGLPPKWEVKQCKSKVVCSVQGLEHFGVLYYPY